MASDLISFGRGGEVETEGRLGEVVVDRTPTSSCGIDDHYKINSVYENKQCGCADGASILFPGEEEKEDEKIQPPGSWI